MIGSIENICYPTYDLSAYRSLDVTAENGEMYADQIIRDYRLPPYRELGVFEKNGRQLCKHSYGDKTYSPLKDIQHFGDPSAHGKVMLSWCSPCEITALSNQNPQLREEINRHLVLKPNRKPSPLDGTIHNIEIWFEPNKNLQMKICYTSGVQSSKWKPILDHNDFTDDDCWNIFTTTTFELPPSLGPARF